MAVLNKNFFPQSKHGLNVEHSIACRSTHFLEITPSLIFQNSLIYSF